jgi:hypothetical protein
MQSKYAQLQIFLAGGCGETDGKWDQIYNIHGKQSVRRNPAHEHGDAHDLCVQHLP